MKVTIQDALHATGATLFDADSAPAQLNVVTDTRSLRPGDTFLALRGDKYNGHDYIREAIAKGAALVVVDEPHARVEGFPCIMVERTQRAYMRIARVSRDGFRGLVIAITGSTGKTTTKALLAQLLVAKYGSRVLASPANENNEIGVSKLLLSATNEAYDAIVVEMGARHFGDIDVLVNVAMPQIGILTNVGDAHLEIVGGRERLEETKWALFSRGARAVLNRDDEVSRRRARTLDALPHWFAVREGADLEGRMTILEQLPVEVRLPGRHNRANLAAAIAGALEMGVELDALLPLVPDLQLPEGRFEAIQLPSGTRLIYDAYNANAAGTMASLDAFADEPGRRRIAVIGSMAELGIESDVLHERTGEHAAAKVDVLLVGGEFAEALARGARFGGLSSERIVPFATNSEAAGWLRANAHADDVVLLKGSRKYKLEEIVEELRS